jgi:phosphoglycerol transferase
MTLSMLVAAWVLHLGRAHLSLPWNYAGEGDAKFYLLVVKNIIGHGWYESNPSLGAPFGQQLYDFPQGADNLNLLAIKGLGVFSSNPALVLNVFFLLTFPLTALSAFLVLRRLRISSAAAVLSSAIFALLPYHFYRGESQVLLSAYYAVPLAALLFLRLWEEPGLFTRRTGATGGPLAWASRRSLVTCACCLVIGSASLYYAVFALALLLGGSVVALIATLGHGGRDRGLRAVVSGTIASLLIAAMLAINLAPTLLYRAEHGTNRSIARTTLQSDQLGLRLTDLVLPVEQHRLAFLSNVNQRYTEATSTGYCEACFENLGGVGSIGFAWLCLVALASIVGVGGVVAMRSAYRPAALGVALSIGVATIGGASSLIAFFVTRDIRGWNRISLFIAFFSLLAIAMLLDAAARRLFRSGRGRSLGGVLLAAVLVLGVLDETSAYFVPKYAKDAREWNSDASFVKTIEARVPAGASIFQLPYVPFPEGYGSISASVSLPDTTFGTTYELARGYIHSESLRWSYGAMKGRAADWQGELAVKPLYLSLAAAAADGFQGLWVDPHGYSASARTRLAPTLSRLLRTPPLYSPAHDLLFFDLRPFAARLAHSHAQAQVQALRYATLHPLRTVCAPDGLELTNPSSTTRTATLSMRLSMRSAIPTTVLIHYPDGSVEPVAPGTKTVKLRRRISLRTGESAVRFSLAGALKRPPARAGGPVVEQPTLTEDAVISFETAPGQRSEPPMAAGAAPRPCPQTVAAVIPPAAP